MPSAPTSCGRLSIQAPAGGTSSVRRRVRRCPWPPFEVSSFTASINYETPAARVQMARSQVVEPGRARPAPAEQRQVQVVSGAHAWNMAVPAGARARRRAGAQPQVEAVAERTMEIWTTLTALTRRPRRTMRHPNPPNGGSDVTFTLAASTGTSAGSTPRIRWSASRPRSTTRCWAIRPSKSRTRATATSAAMFPGQDRADTGRPSGAGHHRLESHDESTGRYRGAGCGAKFCAAGGERRRWRSSPMASTT